MNQAIASRRKGLGQGLSALFDTPSLEKSEETQTEISFLNPSQFITGRYQPRQHFDETMLQELATSIKEQGILHPLIARANAAGEVELIAGERRLKAAVMAGLQEIPCRILPLSEKQALEISLLENVQRHDLSPIDEAKGYERLIGDMGYTQEELSSKIGKSRTHLTNMLRLLKLPPFIQKFIDEGTLSPGHGRALVGCDKAEYFAESAIREGWSVRKMEATIREAKDPAYTQESHDSLKGDSLNTLQPLGPETSALDTDFKGPAALFRQSHKRQPLEEEAYLSLQLQKLTGLKTQVHLKKNGGVIQLVFQNAEELDTFLAGMNQGFTRPSHS